MVGVIGILFIATLISDVSLCRPVLFLLSNLLALYSMVSFSLSAVMSVPAGGKGAEWGQESDYGFHCGRVRESMWADSADYLYDGFWGRAAG